MSTIPETIVAHHAGIKVEYRNMTDILSKRRRNITWNIKSDLLERVDNSGRYNISILMAGVCLQSDYQHVCGGVQHGD